MLTTVAIVITTFAILSLMVVWGKTKKYKKIFSDAHYFEIYNWVVAVLKNDRIDNPTVENGSVITTSGLLKLVYSRTQDSNGDSIHISISQTDGVTTHAVGNRIIYLIFMILNKNKCSADLFYTQTTVHHVVFTRPGLEPWTCNDVSAVVGKMKEFRPLPIRKVEVPVRQ